MNSTTDIVTIVDSKVSCGCSELTLATSVIQPGESATATLSADVAGRYGDQTFEAVLYTDRPASPEIRLAARAILISTKPVDGFHQLGKCLAKQVVSTAVVVRKAGASGIQFLPDESDVRLVEIRDGRNGWVCIVEFEAPDTVGEFQRKLINSAEGNATWKQQKIDIYGQVVSRWQIPETIAMGFLKPNEAAESKFVIEDAFQGTETGKAFPIRSIEFVREPNSSLFECQTQANGTPGEIMVQFPGSEIRGPFAEEIRIAITTDLGTDILPVRIAGHVMGD